MIWYLPWSASVLILGLFFVSLVGFGFPLPLKYQILLLTLKFVLVWGGLELFFFHSNWYGLRFVLVLETMLIIQGYFTFY